MSEVSWEALFEAAAAARRQAYAPYSRFQVGAAILCDDGSVVKGCNVENATYGATVCAERNAVAALVMAGRKPVAVAIVVDSKRVTPPCGLCRQVLAEFATAELPIRSFNLEGQHLSWTVGGLLPEPFTRAFL